MHDVVHNIICYLLAITLTFLPLQALHAEMFHECGGAEVAVVDPHVHDSTGVNESNDHNHIPAKLSTAHDQQQITTDQDHYKHDSLQSNRHPVTCSYCFYQNSCCDDNNCKCHVITSLFLDMSAGLRLVDDLSSAYFPFYKMIHVQHDSVPFLRPPII